MQITTKEHIIGYDLRYFSEQPYWVSERLANFKYIEKFYSYDTDIWPSRFRSATLEENNALNFANSKFRDVSRFIDTTYIVPWSCSRQFNILSLWDNLGSMLLRYGDLHNDDHIIAVTCVIIEKPEIFCRTQYLFHNQTPNIYELTKSEIIPDILREDEWQFLGYDTGESPACSALLTAFDAIIDQPDLREEIAEAEGYVIGDNRNRLGLHDDLETAVYECMLLNQYRDDCPDFVYGLYEAKSKTRLSFF